MITGEIQAIEARRQALLGQLRTAEKQQYWIYVSLQQQANSHQDHVRLYEVHLPEQIIDGVIFQPTTQFLRIDQ